MSPAQISVFCKELAMLFKGGIPLYDACFIMQESAADGKDPGLYKSICRSAQDGLSLEEALKHSEAFPDHMLKMIHIGEESGKLEEVLHALSSYYLRQDQLNRSIKSAVIYPLIMLLSMMLILAVLMTSVLPVFSKVFQQVGAQMPVFLQVMSRSGTAVSILFIIIVLAIAAVLLRCRVTGKPIPLAGAIAELSQQNSFIYSMSLLLSSGANADDAVAMFLELTPPGKTQMKIQQLKTRMEHGESFSHGLAASGLLPSQYAAMISVGEKTGNMDEMMDMAAQRCSEDADLKVSRILSCAEPAAVIIMCLIVGSVLMSVMLPLMKIMAAM